MSDDNNILKLRKPITVIGEQVTELKFREPVAGDLWNLKIRSDGMALGDILEVAAKLCGIPPESMRQMHPKDAMEAVARLGPFLA